MSAEPPEFPPGLPVLFFQEDPEEKRQRIEGARPPHPSMPLPRPGQPDDPLLEYPLIQFPWEPWQAALETQSQARSYASWLTEITAERLATLVPLLTQAGAPMSGLRENPGELAELGGWLQRAFPALAAPLIEQGFLSDDPWSLLGWAHRAHSPRSAGYSRQLDALIGSMTVDLALLVADCASAVRPGHTWQPFFRAGYDVFVLGFDPERPQADLLAEIAEFLTQTAARPRGTRGRELRAWYARTLLRGYERAVAGADVPDVLAAFPDANGTRRGPRRQIVWQNRGGPAPPEVTAAVAAYRAAGWFETVKRDTEQLARAVPVTWRHYEHEDIAADPAQLHRHVLMLDSGRTWSDDVEAGVQPGDGNHAQLLEAVSHIRGKELDTIWDPEEDWAIRPGDLLLTVRTRRGKKKLLVPAPGQYLSAAVFTGLNDLSPTGGPRLWFVDQGPPVAIVTRATAAERAALQDVTGLRLDPEPPLWWTDLAPLSSPSQRESMVSPESSGRGRKSSGQAAGDRETSGPSARPASAGPVKSRTSAAGGRERAGSRKGATGGAESPPGQAQRAGEPTAQASFGRMMRDLIAPALRDLGFTGSWSRSFSYRSGDYEGTFWTQKSRHSTREEVIFWVHLGAWHVPTDSVYWERQLHALIPGNRDQTQWTVRACSPAESAEELLAVFRSYGWPAIQAALDSPGYPPGPGVVWPRSFPPQPSPAARGAAGPDLGPLTWPLRRTGQRDDLLGGVAHPDEWVRAGAVSDLAVAAGRDAQVTEALFNRLERDPSPLVRAAAAHGLTPLASQPSIRAALRAAAAEDEDVGVRWAARYAIRLAGPAGAASP
jgi:hypothetical protein